jgi:hypothetical protein
LRQTREACVYPQIPVAPVVTSLFLGALLRLPSWLKLAKMARKKTWQRLLQYPQALNHEVFNYVSEFLFLADLREHLYAVARRAQANKALDRYKLGGYQVVALDANESFASRSRCCEACGTRLAVNLTTLFYRHWVAPRAAADFTVSDLIEECREHLGGEADWERCLDSS